MKKLPKYLVVGTVTNILDIVAFNILILFGSPAGASNLISVIASSIANYVLNSRYVFSGRWLSGAHSAFKFAIVTICFVALQVAFFEYILTLLSNAGLLALNVGRLGVILGLTVLRFYTLKLVAFR